MIQRTITLLAIFLLSLNCFSQSPYPTYTKTIRTISKHKIRPGNRVQVLVTPTFILYTSHDELVEQTRQHKEKYHFSADSIMLQKLTDTTQAFTKNLEDIQNDSGLKSRLEFVTADLLERGKCLIYNKWRKAPIREILVTSYINSTVAGKRFYTFNGLTVMNVIMGSY
jgi:hypothetical protein